VIVIFPWNNFSPLFLNMLQEPIWPVVGNTGGDVCNHCNEVGWELWRCVSHCTPLIWSRTHSY